MNGIFYGIGVGPGDPELMTLKAVRLIHENKIIACAGDAVSSAAYQIAVQAVPELAQKTLLSIPMPMTYDKIKLRQSHEDGAALIESYLKQGENVLFLTLGDVTIYSTFSYLQRIVSSHGYSTAYINGIPSFCAAAARTDQPLTEWQEPLHIIPAAHQQEIDFSQPGNYVLMKSGRTLPQIKKTLLENDMTAVLVENCGMPGEHIYNSISEMPDTTGYYSLMIVRKNAGLTK